MSDVTLHLGDCLDVMASLPDGSVDAVVTSPPYDDVRTYASGHSFDFEGVAGQIVRLLKPGGVLAWIVNDGTSDGSESGTSFQQALHFKSLGLNLHDTMIYEKINYVPLTHRRYEQAFEFMFVLSKGSPKTWNPITEACVKAGKNPSARTHYRDGEQLTSMGSKGALIKDSKYRSNIWRYSCGNASGDTITGHPAVFPLQLAIDHVTSWTNPGDTVLDPFTGSGTTGVACINTGRNFVGVELSPEYHAIAEKRIADARLRLDRPHAPPLRLKAESHACTLFDTLEAS